MKNLDPLTLLCREYVKRRDYWAAYAIIDTIALVNPGKADAMQRAAFHRSVRQTAADVINYVLGGNK
jgi:hypothetical protein